MSALVTGARGRALGNDADGVRTVDTDGMVGDEFFLVSDAEVRERFLGGGDTASGRHRFALFQRHVASGLLGDEFEVVLDVVFVR